MDELIGPPRVNVIKCMRDVFPDMYIYVRIPSLSVCSFIPNMRVSAVEYEHESIVRYLIDHGADIHAEDEYVLRWASSLGKESFIRYLIEKGANVNANDDYALRWAAHNGHESIVRYLVENGADVHADNDGALRWTIKNNHESIVRYLVEMGAD